MAKADIPLSTRIRADQVEMKTLHLTAISAGAFADISQVIGQVARQPVTAGAQITATTLNGGLSGTVIDVQTPAGLRAIAVRVDQTSGVGTVIKTGDYVDAIIALTEEQFASVTQDPANPNQVIVTNPGPKGATVKLILQGMQVLGTLLPPVAPPAGQRRGIGRARAAPGTVLNEQQEIVILAVTAQQAEVIRYAQLHGEPAADAVARPSLAGRLHRSGDGRTGAAGARRDDRHRPPDADRQVRRPAADHRAAGPADRPSDRPASTGPRSIPRPDGRDGPPGPAPVEVSSHEPTATRQPQRDGRSDPCPRRR